MTAPADPPSALPGAHWHTVIGFVLAASCQRTEELLERIPLEDRARMARKALTN